MKNEIKAFVSGDFCPAYVPVEPLLKVDAAKEIFGDFYDIIQSSDLSITNLECPLTLSNCCINKIGPNLKSHPEIALLLKTAGFNMVTLANNHIYDFGQQGLLDTIETLKNSSISYLGAGLCLQEAKKTSFIEIKDIKLGIVNFAENEFCCADEEHGGANPMDLIENVYQIQEARKNSDHVLVIIHGGNEYYPYPNPNLQKQYRFYAENGASVVISHHTHCIGGYEHFNNVPIFYSLGNFFFPSPNNKSECWHTGYAISLTISKDKLSFELLPFEQCKEGILRIESNRSNDILDTINILSRDLKDKKKIVDQWKAFSDKRSIDYLALSSGFGSFMTAIFRRLGLLEFLFKKKQLKYVLQLVRCESHNELSKEVLQRFLK